MADRPTRSPHRMTQEEADGGSADPFSPLTIRSLRLPNRFIKAATHTGSTFDELATQYCRMARHGCALLTCAYMAVSPVDKTFDNQLHIDDANVAQWRELCARVRKAGGHLSAQLHHPGLFCMSARGVPKGPSFFYLPSKLAWPHVLSVADLEQIKAQYVRAALLCVSAGFSALELHAGHGYLLSQFLTPLLNRRTDGYGGRRPEDRARFPAAVLEAVRRAVGPSLPIFVKMNVDDGLPWYRGAGGLHADEAVAVARIFAASGADAIVPSYGYTSLNGFGMLRGDVPLGAMANAMPHVVASLMLRLLGWLLVPSLPYSSAFLRESARRFVTALAGSGCEVIYVGGADSLESVRAVLALGCCAVQIGRPLIREPWYVRKLERCAAAAAASRSVGDTLGEARALVQSRSTCVRCNQCTLAAIDPLRFPAGCPHLEAGEGRDFGDMEDLVGVAHAPRSRPTVADGGRAP